MLILMCLISCLFGFANVQPIDHMQKQVDNVQYVESKSSKNRVKTGSGYYEYGTTDLFNIFFLEGLINYYVDDLGYSDFSPNNNNSSQIILRTNDIYSIYLYDSSNQVYTSVYSVSNIIFEKVVPNPNNSRPYFYYTFTFANASPYDKQFSISFYAQRTIDNQLTIWGVSIGLSPQLSNVAQTDYWYPYFKLSERIYNMESFIGNIYNTILSDQYNIGYTQGYNDSYGIGYAYGYNVGHNEGYYEGEVYGYQQGYTNGVNDTQVIGEGTQASIIFGGILDVAFIPVNVFLLMFQYEVFGINIAGLVSGLISIALIIILIRVITGKKLW